MPTKRLPGTSVQDLQRLQGRVERRRPQPETKRPSEYYQNLITQHDTAMTVIRNRYADATKDNLFSIKGKFIRFCDDQLRNNWRSVLRDCSQGIMLAFLRYIFDKDRMKKRGAMQQYIAQFKMLYNRENGRHMDTNDGKEALKRHRIQFALILLLLFGTGCRPAELVDAKKKRRDQSSSDDDADDDGDAIVDGKNSLAAKEGDDIAPKGIDAGTGIEEYIRQFDAICFEDVRLLVVRRPGSEERDVLAMEITLAHHKGHRRRPKPNGSPVLTVQAPQFRHCLNRLGKAAGIEETLTSYCFRRGTANVVDHAATEAVRDQVMRHNPNSAVYNGSYINERVRFDVESAVLERPSTDGVLRMLTHMSLMRDPRAPIHVPDDVLAALPSDQGITALEQEREQLKAGGYRVQGTNVEAEVRRLTALIGSARSRRRKFVSEEYRADYFRRRPTEDIERQNSGHAEEEYVETVIEHQIPQSTLLAKLLCTRVTNFTAHDAVNCRIQTADLMQALCGCREVASRYRLRVTQPLPTNFKENPPKVKPTEHIFPLVCSKTQCPFCIGDESKSYEERTGSFCRPAKMMDHVERRHLKGRDPEASTACHHPTCKAQGLVLKHVEHFKNHVQSVHGIMLREPRFVHLK
ncbi:hypothetical protein BJ878DRAFT_479840 [Calycina marina]|uniref:FluG domain-containing protein n=1 Tax=Calycina marina TaxID=1763456 RepID=A0A9P7Z3S5_9HELO|nr:hypothetical protein BJ878DRAFT_479840 [Calycina marina]